MSPDAGRPACPLCRRRADAWTLGRADPDAARAAIDEVLFGLGNGYLFTRNSAPEAVRGRRGYPGVYVAGVYDRLATRRPDGERVDESIVNLPTWLGLRIASERGELLDRDRHVDRHEHQLLDLRRGVVRRILMITEVGGERTLLRHDRFISMSDPHLAYLRVSLHAENWSGPVSITSFIDESVVNGNVASHAGLANRHLTTLLATADRDAARVLSVTRQSRITVATVTRTRVRSRDRRVRETAGPGPQQTFDLDVQPRMPATIDVTACVFTSRDRAISEPEVAAARGLAAADPHPAARRAHVSEWRHVWQRMRLTIATGEGSRSEQVDVQRAINLHLFHVAQTLSRHTADLDVGVPARGLHGEGYRGHVFWDELFVFPLLNLRIPELTRSLLMYRYRRLTEARRAAAALGSPGARFPWQSGSDGRDETPASLFNPLSGRWIADGSWRQFHVGLAVGFNVWQYYQVTGDVDFLASHGAELLIEIARFWASRAQLDAKTDRFHLRGMMGPDEFHDGPPGRPGAGIDDDAYVAVMTSWLLTVTLRVHEVLGGGDADELWQRLGVTDDELEHWSLISRRLFVPFLSTGLIAQFAGYEALADLDLDAYRRRYGDIGRLDLILAAEHDSTNRYRVSKQADVLMLFYLFSAEELTAILDRLGYSFDPATIPATIEYYLARTTHGSTLSRVVHAWVLSRGDRHGSWHLLREALDADLDDTQHGTTREGVHLGAMAATADILQRCYTGIATRDDTLFLHPQLPDAVTRLDGELRYRGHRLDLSVTHRMLELRSRPGGASPIAVSVDDRTRRLGAGEVLRWTRPR